MKLDLNLYVINKAFIWQFYENQGRKDVSDAVSIIAATTHCPVLACLFYMAEHLGYTPEICKKIESLIKFYDYKEIAGQSADSPFLHYSGGNVTILYA